MRAPTGWFKSSHSGASTDNCVEPPPQPCRTPDDATHGALSAMIDFPIV